MNLPTLIDVGLGLALVFFILASLGSLLAELWAAWRKLRHRQLHETVDRLLGAKIAGEFWQHSLILPLYDAAPKKHGADENAPAEQDALPLRVLKSSAHLAFDYGVRKPWRGIGLRRAEAPAYLDAQLFAAVVLDIAAGRGKHGRIPNDAAAWRHAIKESIEELPGDNNDLNDHLRAILRQVPAELPDFAAGLKAAIARWYEEAMQRASGAYRRKTQKALFFIGCALALALNADALRIAHILYVDPEVRTDISNMAVNAYTEQTAGGETPNPGATEQADRRRLQSYSAELRDMVKVGFPLGWMPVWRENFIRVSASTNPASPAAAPVKPNSEPVAATSTASAAQTESLCALLDRRISTGSEWLGEKWQTFISPGWTALLAKLAGLLVGALAVCLGAPFWFDVLGRLVKLRTSAGSAAEKPKETAPSAAAGAATATPGPAPVPALPASSAPAAPVPLPPALDSLAAPGIEFDVARSYWLAEFADRAYETDPAELKRWLRENGFTLAAAFDKSGTQGFLATSETSAVLAFRGTEKKLEDWVAEAKFELVDSGDAAMPGKVHRGFKEALALVATEVDVALDRLQGRRLLLHVTGHSLGAALATLAALRCTCRPPTADLLHSLHTYGSPRVGDEQFTAAFTARLSQRTYRIVNNEDLVTRVPPRQLDYEHVGTLIYIDEAGRIQRDLGYWYRFLNFATNALGDLQTAVKTTVKDHSMRLYCGHLSRAARQPAPAGPRAS